MSASTMIVVLQQNRRRTSYGAVYAACACERASAHTPWASMHGLTSELSSTCGRRSPSRTQWTMAAFQPRKSGRRCSPSACGTHQISSHTVARTGVQKYIETGPASNGRSRETRTHRGLLRVDAPIITPRAGTVVIKLLETGRVLLAPGLPAKTSRLTVPTLGKRRPSQRRDTYAWTRESTIVTFKVRLNLAHVGRHSQPHRKLTWVFWAA
jgi:hypothetical protein